MTGYRSYDHLLHCCRRVIERNWLTWARNELSKSMSAGGRALVNKDEGRDGSKGKDKKGRGKSDKKKTAAGDRRRDKSGSRNRFQSKEKTKSTGNICSLHVKGRCRARDKCPNNHNPPCKFVKSPGGGVSRVRLVYFHTSPRR